MTKRAAAGWVLVSFQYYLTCIVCWTAQANGFSAPKPTFSTIQTTPFQKRHNNNHGGLDTTALSSSAVDSNNVADIQNKDSDCSESKEKNNNNGVGDDGVEWLATDFMKPRLDDREYRSIRLPHNGLECLLVSDGRTDVESAAVHVKAGHFDDPVDRAGLAHFHEHMLFLGTAKYPDEQEYESYLGSHGGSSNAYTDMQDTNYFFSLAAPLIEDTIETDDDNDNDDDDDDQSQSKSDDAMSTVSESLHGALDRFSQFFIKPNFNVGMMEREMQAVDSEYKNSITSDSWRMYQTLKSSANPKHPFSKFGCGNYQTLSDKPMPQDDLFQFWNKHYRGDNMKLCVVGRASLDALQKSVVETFGHLPSRQEELVVVDGKVETKQITVNDNVTNGSVQEKKNREKETIEENPALFVQEHSKYDGIAAFGTEQLGKIRETIPVVEARSIILYFATPPMDDPAITHTRPYHVISHILGHESPGSLHALLLQEGLINDLCSGVGVDTSDFSLCNLSLSMTPKGMANKQQVLDLVWQYIALIKNTMITDDDNDRMAKYHDEMRDISRTNFEWRENGDPTDFCSNAAELLFDYPPHKILIASSQSDPYNDVIAKQFFERFSPDNCIISIVQPETDMDDNVKSEDSTTTTTTTTDDKNGPWQTEPWYGAKYREVNISDELKEKWSNPDQKIDERLSLPQLNDFITTDFSLRSEDEKIVVDKGEDDVDYREIPPKLLSLENNMAGLTMWHKLDQTFKVPKSYIRLQITSPNAYRSPRSMTYARLFQKVLEDDLNSYVYDATVAGCYYKVFCTPSGFRINISGFSEKLPLLLDVVVSRVMSIIQEMKEENHAENSPLSLKFDKAVENLLRETKNFRMDSPYETATYLTRMLLEDNVWHVDNYITEMEGEYFDKNPLTLQECASVVDECLSERTLVQSLCMGNIDEDGVLGVAKVIEERFLSRSRPLTPEEFPRLRSLKTPTREEAIQIFGQDVASSPIPIVVEDVASSESEENHAVEVVLQAGAEYDLGFEGTAIIELIGHIAYNSAFNQLRTKEQLGYIVSAYIKKSAGGVSSLGVVVQSASTLPDVLEERVLNWLDIFRSELEEITPERYAMEAEAIVAQLLERNMRLSDEVASSWGEILSTDPSSKRFKDPQFTRVKTIAQVLTVDEPGEGSGSDVSDIKTSADLKKKVLNFYDKYFTRDAPQRRIMSSRVYGYSARSNYEANKEKVGILSNYDDTRELKRFLSVWPSAPYWI
eukprot:CAMPEP_0197828904 /NCGR_PEP_ID=MMETSP1437-20131217/5400_1 /TAXON_ID=49252 ORGANISM="Eucampia antarctica, Strain CCMP1452" /NCGR_SAMPLE_ID=MMETSP1437 /ASSEMBLY_ACC=CAM_ASM_001096 /LENGTH=1242 /DNA_ID=CAMNT_0043430317 /DNA_START=34 /DNA_END=3762 /DNA_ORIENTATION=+